jgi:hypothetical protein
MCKVYLLPDKLIISFIRLSDNSWPLSLRILIISISFCRSSGPMGVWILAICWSVLKHITYRYRQLKNLGYL